MSDATETEPSAKPLFTVAEVEQFSDDDVTAGRAIGKMLSALFLYTVFAMILVTWWTFRSVDADHSTDTEANTASEAAH